MGVEDKQADAHYVTEASVEKRQDYDSESQSGAAPHNGTLKRQLKNRHIAMIRYVFFQGNWISKLIGTSNL